MLVGNFLLWGESVPRVFANKKRPSLTNFPEIWGLGRLGSVPTDPPTGFQLPMHLLHLCQTRQLASNAPFAPRQTRQLASSFQCTSPDPPTGHLLASNKPSLSPTQPVCPSVLTIYYFHMTCRPTGQDPRKADLGARPVVQLPPPSARLCRVN